jgi:hypothetical protein
MAKQKQEERKQFSAKISKAAIKQLKQFAANNDHKLGIALELAIKKGAV